MRDGLAFTSVFGTITGSEKTGLDGYKGIVVVADMKGLSLYLYIGYISGVYDIRICLDKKMV